MLNTDQYCCLVRIGNFFGFLHYKLQEAGVFHVKLPRNEREFNRVLWRLYRFHGLLLC